MSRQRDISGEALRIPPGDAQAGDRARAIRHVMLRVERGEMSRAEAREFLECLGLIPPRVAPPSRVRSSGMRRSG